MEKIEGVCPRCGLEVIWKDIDNAYRKYCANCKMLVTPTTEKRFEIAKRLSKNETIAPHTTKKDMEDVIQEYCRIIRRYEGIKSDIMDDEEVIYAIIEKDWEFLSEYVEDGPKAEECELKLQHSHDARDAYPSRMKLVKKALKKMKEEE